MPKQGFVGTTTCDRSPSKEVGFYTIQDVLDTLKKIERVKDEAFPTPREKSGCNVWISRICGVIGLDHDILGTEIDQLKLSTPLKDSHNKLFKQFLRWLVPKHRVFAP